MKRGLDWFLVGMVLAVLLAWAFPAPGAQGGWLHPEFLNKAGVALIFFLHGAGLSFAALKAGTLNWRLHLVVQCCTFLLFPLLGLAGVYLFGPRLDPNLALGFFYLCALPSTVSSSVALTAAARGNVPAAVFNATLSSLLGIFLTPLWVGLKLKTGGDSFPLLKVILDLILWLLLPLLLGQLSRPWTAKWISKHKSRVGIVDRAIILLLVYTSFCDSMKWGIWSGHGWKTVGLGVLVSLCLFCLVMFLVRLTSSRLGFPIEDQITAMFCGSKKTLASGVPMARLIFGDHAGLSMILLPIMLYHPLQLVLCGWLAGRWARRKPE